MISTIQTLKNLRVIFLLIVIGLFLPLQSCDEHNASSSMLYTSSGRTSEALVVIGNSYWKGMVGDTIRSVLEEVKPWLAREEPNFDLTQIPPSAFMGIYHKFRNVLLVRIEEGILENQLKARENVYAKPQIIVEIKCKSKADFIELFSNHQQQIMALFHRNELVRILDAYKGLEVDSITQMLNKQFGFTMVFPKGFFLAKKAADFMWLRKETPDIEEGFLIYTQPYTDTADFELDTIVARRNIITKRYIPGPINYSWMKVSDVFPPYYQETSFNDSYAALVRSWWDIENYPLGGPFISYTFVDEKAGRLITIDGYIMAPKKEKRDLLLHLEAIMSSFKMD
jgi:hypothetical protein